MSTLEIYEKLRKVLDEKVAIEIAEAIEKGLGYYEKMVTKDEFGELKEVVSRLAVAQEKSEERLSKLEEKMAELAEAQKKTEERLGKLEEKMAELAEAQKRTEERLNELAEAQKKTEERLNELAEAQRRTEDRVNELAEAQKKTEERVDKLAKAQENTEKVLKKLIMEFTDLKEQVGAHSHTIGHFLEDKAIVKLPKILREKYGFKLEGKLKRGFLENEKGQMEEINIFGFAKKNGKKYLILGEGKSRFSKGDLKDFLKKIERFKKRYKDVFPLVVTYIFSSYDIEEEVKRLNIPYFLSFELE